jgi:hypothetical protein
MSPAWCQILTVHSSLQTCRGGPYYRLPWPWALIPGRALIRLARIQSGGPGASGSGWVGRPEGQVRASAEAASRALRAEIAAVVGASQHLARPPRPCPHPARRPDRAAGIRAHRRRFPSRCRTHVRCTRKGRKQQCTPLTAQTASYLDRWLDERHPDSHDPVFCIRVGSPLSVDAVARLLANGKQTGALSLLSVLTGMSRWSQRDRT